jgi:putative spermidine/putrescine transport system permease protein
MELVSRRQSGIWSVVTVHNAILAAVLAVLVMGLGYPFVVTIKESFAGPSYHDIFAQAGSRAVLWNTIVIACEATPVAVLLAFLVSHFMWNASPLWNRVMIVLLVIPYFTSILVKAFAWTVMLQDSGPINRVLQALGITNQPVHLLFTRGAVIVGMVHYMLPVAVVPIYVALMRVNKNLIRVSRSMGASKATTLFLVTIPLAKTGIITSVVTTFVLSVGFYITPAMLGGRKDQMVANLIDTAIKKLYRNDIAAALSVIVFMGIIVLLPFALRMLRPPEEAK